ncbi:hypothetical protein Tco_0497679 [Tanacetum coccineum]
MAATIAITTIPTTPTHLHHHLHIINITSSPHHRCRDHQQHLSRANTLLLSPRHQPPPSPLSHLLHRRHPLSISMPPLSSPPPSPPLPRHPHPMTPPSTSSPHYLRHPRHVTADTDTTIALLSPPPYTTTATSSPSSSPLHRHPRCHHDRGAVGVYMHHQGWVWSKEGSGEFSVASVRRMIDDRWLPNVSAKTRWTSVVPIKINVHAWKKRLAMFSSLAILLERCFTKFLTGGSDMSDSDELRHTDNTTLVPPRLPDTLLQVYQRRRPTLGLLILPHVSPFPPTIRRIACISVLPIEPNLAERARISAINLDDYQLDPLTSPPSPSSPFSMAAYHRMIAETDTT